MKSIHLLACSLLLTGAVACGKSESTTAPSASANPTTPDSFAAAFASAMASVAASASAVPTAAAPVELVDKDLSKVSAKFKGWSAKGPEGATVMEDMSGARIATKKVSGPGSFDLGIALQKRDLKEWKKNITTGAEAGKAKLTFTSDTATELEWKSEYTSFASYDFIVLMKVGGKDVTCYSVTPRESAAELASLKEACKTIAHK